MIHLVDKLIGNHLLAIAMGFEANIDGYLGKMPFEKHKAFYKTVDLKFDEDWNWLIEAIKTVGAWPQPAKREWKAATMWANVTKALKTYDREDTYRTLTVYVKWYNENHKKKAA